MWLKICGVIRSEDAWNLARLDIDAIGLNRYAPSPRYLSRKRAAEFSRQIKRADENKLVVGVYVNASAGQINKDIEEIGLDAVQLHGDEPPDFLAEIKPAVKLIKAFRVDENFSEEEFKKYNCWAYLLDAHVPGKYGGTGQTAPWQKIAGWTDKQRIILAGGLNKDNITRAVKTVNPFGVDFCSGVEDRQGNKDIAAVKEIIEKSGVK
ncbi:MAG: phosphoribosylanthranilate isomerase [bacterium]